MSTTHGFSKSTMYEPTVTYTTTYSHAPNCTLVDLDYPMYGNVVVKCGGRKFDLEVVRKALSLAAELGGELKNGKHR